MRGVSLCGNTNARPFEIDFEFYEEIYPKGVQLL